MTATATATKEIKINISKTEGIWYYAMWVDGEYDHHGELDVLQGAGSREAIAEAETMELAIDGNRTVTLV